jgi:hypothetical protein
MLFNPVTAKSEMARRYAFVSEGAQTARWLRRLAKDKICDCGDRLIKGAGQALIAASTWMRRGQQSGSAHA